MRQSCKACADKHTPRSMMIATYKMAQLLSVVVLISERRWRLGTPPHQIEAACSL